MDIGPKSIVSFTKILAAAKTIVWNGPLGLFEKKPFDRGTMAVARAIGRRVKGQAYGLVGGGETVQALEQSGMSKYIDHVSTGGGAMLEFLGGKILPAIIALNARRPRK